MKKKRLFFMALAGASIGGFVSYWQKKVDKRRKELGISSTGKDMVKEASEESFPASDPPSSWTGVSSGSGGSASEEPSSATH